MKIIAHARSDRLLLEATADEVAQILGFENAKKPGAPKFEIGSLINVSDLFSRVRATDGLTSQLEAAQLEITKVAFSIQEALKATQEIFEPPKAPGGVDVERLGRQVD